MMMLYYLTCILPHKCDKGRFPLQEKESNNKQTLQDCVIFKWWSQLCCLLSSLSKHNFEKQCWGKYCLLSCKIPGSLSKVKSLQTNYAALKITYRVICVSFFVKKKNNPPKKLGVPVLKTTHALPKITNKILTVQLFLIISLF